MRDRLRQMLEEDQESEPAKRRHRLLERAEFDQLCDDMGGISDKEALLDFLHYNGVIFYRPGLFENQIILDQNWALEAVYSIFHRDKCLKQLKKLHGRGVAFVSQEVVQRKGVWIAPEEQDRTVFALRRRFGLQDTCVVETFQKLKLAVCGISNDATKLIINPGLLARYDRMNLLAELSGDVGRKTPMDDFLTVGIANDFIPPSEGSHD